MMAQRVKALAAKSDNPGTYMLTEEDVLLHATYRHTHACTQRHPHTDVHIHTCMHTQTQAYACIQRHTKRYITE